MPGVGKEGVWVLSHCVFFEVPTTDFSVWVNDYMCDVQALGSIPWYRHLGPMSLFLRESRRKTPVIVTLKENERFFGDSAASMVS